MRGELFVFSESKRLVGFMSNAKDAAPKNALVFLGGLTDGFMATGYLKPLAEAIGPEWALVQALLSSSYSGWGTASLQTGADAPPAPAPARARLHSTETEAGSTRRLAGSPARVRNADCDDIDELLGFLRPRLGAGARIVLMGHSTGAPRNAPARP